MTTSEKLEPLTIDPKRLASIAYHVVGVHTEAGPTPYTGAANAGGASGLSIGTMQHDFGQRPATAPGYANAIVDWYVSNNKSLGFTSAQLATGILKKSLTQEQRTATAEFGGSGEGATWIYENLERSHVDAAVEAAQQAFATPYGQAILADGTHVEEFAAFSMKIFNQYGGGPLKIKGDISEYKLPGFQGLLAYLDKGQVELRDNRSGHDGETIVIAAKKPTEFDRDDLLAYSRGYASTRSNQKESNSPTLGDNRAIISGPRSALNSGALYGAILDSDSPLGDVLKRVESKGDFSPTLTATDPDVALARAVFGADTGRMENAVAAINDAITLDPISVSATLGQYPGTLWIEPLSGRIAISYKSSNSGFVVSANGYAKFAASAVVKDDNVRTLQIGEGETAVTFDQVATSLANAGLPREAPPATASAVSVPSPVSSNSALANPNSVGPALSINHTTTGTIYLSRDGASATLPDGRVINAGPGEKLELNVDGNLSVTRSVSGYKAEDAVYSVTLYKRSGQVVADTQMQVVVDPAHPNNPAYSTTVVQGQEREITQIQPDGSSTTVKTMFQTGFGWVEQATGEVVQTVAEWAQERSAQISAPRSESSGSDTDAQSIFRRFELQQQNGRKDNVVTSLRTLSPDELRAFETGLAQAAAAGPGANYADAGNYSGNTTATDAGGGSDPRAQAQQLIQAKAEASQAASAVSLMNSIIGLQNWDNMSDLQRTAAVASIYNVADKLSKDALPGDLGTVASALGLLNALDKGDPGSILVSGVSLIDSVAGDVASKAIGSALGIDPANVVPGIGLALAIESGNPMSMLAAAANFIPIYGQFISVALSVLGSAFGDDAPDLPMREGLAHAEWDAAGNTVVVTDQDIEGGGPTAAAWMSSMVDGLQARLANVHDEAGSSYALIPNLLPAIGFQYDPDGFNLGNSTKGFVYLKWNDESGQSQTRYYDGEGKRSDGTGETLAGDFMQHAAGAVAPAWAVATTLAHYQQGQGIELPRVDAGLPQVMADGLQQAVQAITLALPVEPALQDALIDVDADGYLERTQWLATNQQVLAIDVDGNGQTGLDELLSLDGLASRHSLDWLDANGDQMLTDRDPAFAALRLWMDVNADADSNGETQAMADAGIVAIDFGSGPPAAVYADGSRSALTLQSLTADVLGVRYEAIEGGILELDEQIDGPATATLHAVNTREFDGQPDHVHGGADDTDGGEERVDAGDERLVTTSADTTVTNSMQTSTTLAAGDARVRSGAAGHALAGQSTNQTSGAAQVRNGGLVFVSTVGQVGVGAQMREATEAMMRSANEASFVPLAALAIGAAAVQWPTVAAAAFQAQETNETAAVAPVAQTAVERIDWQTWDGSRVGAAIPGGSASDQPQALTPITWGAAPGGARDDASAVSGPQVPVEWAVPAITSLPHGESPASAPAHTANTAVPDDANETQASRVAAPLAPSTSTLLDYPEVLGEQANSLEDTDLRFLEALLLANDSTVNAVHSDESGLRITSVFAPVHGSVSLQINARGLTEVVFLPEANYHGAASFDYTVTDPYGLSSNARVSLDIAAVNDAPITQDGNASAAEDMVLYFAPADLLASASDADIATDDQQLSVSEVVAARHGVAVLMQDGRIRFTPDADYNQGIDGLASFTYSVSDGTGGNTPATVWLSLAAVNDAPRLQDDSANTLEDQPLRIDPADLLTNDFDVDNAHADLRITAVSDALHGNVSLQAQPDGSTRILFTPEANYHGIASFRYTVTDPDGASSAASAQLVLAAVNDAPVALGETAGGDEDTALLFTAASLLANDSDVDIAVDGDVLRITRVEMAEHGQVFLQPDGTVRFEPDANYNGPARFSYWVGDRDPAQFAAGDGYETAATVNLTILAVNDLPVVTGETLDGDEDIVLNINPSLLLANDTDVDTVATSAEPAQVLSITAVGNAQHGSIALLADGSLQFTPERNYVGAAGFSYTVDDGHGGQVQGQVALNLAPVNDAPDVLGEVVTFQEDEIQTMTQASFLVNDSDVDNPHSDLRIVSVDNATHGTVLLNPDGSIRFVPDADYFGAAQFTYTVSDGSGGFTVGLASLEISAVNDAPRLTGEMAAFDEDTQVRFEVAALLANDSDVDNTHAELTVTAAGDASHGSVQIVAGEIFFTPELNFNGTASFTYTVSDGVGGLTDGVGLATVTMTFNAVNDAPAANDELVWGKRDVSYTLTQAALLANDSDAESPTDLRVSAISNVQHGTAVLNADGSVRFTPEAGYAGRGSFDYMVQDPEGASSNATAEIDFSQANVNPSAMDDSFTGYEDIPFSITQAQLLVNDSDIDNVGADLRVTAVGGASNGAVSLQADGSVRFVPASDFNGTASFSYQVVDGDGGQTWATARLTVQPVNDAPVIDEIIYGRPVYGYLPGAVSTEDVAIYDEARALSLANGGFLYSRTYRGSIGDSEGYGVAIYDYAMVSATYYRNGHMRPVFIETVDATYQDPNNYEKWMYPGDGIRPVDDPYRQNGYIVAYDPDGNSAAISFAISSGPQHGHAWADQFTAHSTPRDYSYTVAQWYAVAQTGAWQYYSQRGDPYSGADPFTVAVTDGGGATTYLTVNTAQVGSIGPVALDLGGGGLQYLGLVESKARFDVDSKEGRESLAWIAPGDALLARDIGGDKLISRADEIVFTGYLPGAKTDLQGLAAFDSNGNSLLDRGDDKWHEFGAWQDRNGNGISDAGEFVELDEIGITQVELQSDHLVRQPVQGVTELGQSRFSWSDGRTGAVGDVMLAVAAEALAVPATQPAVELASPAAAEPVSLSPRAMALQMAHVIATATAEWERVREGGPLGLDGTEMHGSQTPSEALFAAQAEWTQGAQSSFMQLHGSS